MLFLVKKRCRKNEALRAVATAGWQSEPDMAFPDIESPLYCEPLVRRSSPNAPSTELDVFKLMVGRETPFINYMSAHLQQHKRPARSKAPSVREFWISTGLKICNNLKWNQSIEGERTRVDEAKRRLENGLSSRDRSQVLQAAFSIEDAEWPSVVSHLRSQWCENINPGVLMVVDETILGSESKQAYHEGKLKYIEGKPHPKGYFFNGALQRFRYSQCVFLLDLVYKLGFNSSSMGDALLELVERCENQFSKTFVVFADSGYPAGRFLLDPQPAVSSKFIASVSVAKVSGALRKLPEAFEMNGSLGKFWVLTNRKLGLVAFLTKSKEYTQCLVTNYYNFCEIHSDPPKLTYDQAMGLASLFRVSELVKLCKLPPPPPSSNMSSQTWLFIKHHFGVDLASPVDSTGKVTASSLNALDLPSVRIVASAFNVRTKPGMTKGTIIAAILRVHPMALCEATDKPARVAKKEYTEQSASHLLKSLQKEHRNLMVKLLQTCSSKPDWACTYSASYGWQDRFNGLIYDSLSQSSSPTPQTKLGWFSIFAPLLNAYGFWCELSLSNLPNAKAKVRAAASLPSFRLFICNVLCQLADWVETINDDHPVRLSRRSSLV